MSKRRVLILVAFVALLFVFSANTAWAMPHWWPIVPCGLNKPTAAEQAAGKQLLNDSYYQPCSRCDLFRLIRNVMDFIVEGLVPPVAVLFYTWAGFLILMAGAKPDWVSRGSKMFWTTTIGILIIMGSWLITNTIIKSIVKSDAQSTSWWTFECTETVPAGGNPPGGNPPLSTVKYDCNADNQCAVKEDGRFTTPTCNDFCQSATTIPSITTPSLSDATQNQSYTQPINATGGTSPYTWAVSSGNLPAGLSLSSTGIVSGTPTATGTSTFTVKIEDSSSPKKSATKQLSVVVTGPTSTLTCGAPWETNLCQARAMTCTVSACSQYVSAINQYASRTGVANGVNFLKAIMIKESACNVAAQSGSVPSSCGLMQLKASTANIYKSRCGVSNNVDITCDWLRNSVNANASICIAAEYMNALTQSVCGSTPRGVAAGYNGGSGACSQSTDCAGATNCAGGAVQRWECLYDNPQHTVCNTGPTSYDETRDYATKVLYCYNNPGF